MFLCVFFFFFLTMRNGLKVRALTQPESSCCLLETPPSGNIFFFFLFPYKSFPCHSSRTLVVCVTFGFFWKERKKNGVGRSFSYNTRDKKLLKKKNIYFPFSSRRVEKKTHENKETHLIFLFFFKKGRTVYYYYYFFFLASYFYFVI